MYSIQVMHMFYKKQKTAVRGSDCGLFVDVGWKPGVRPSSLHPGPAKAPRTAAGGGGTMHRLSAHAQNFPRQPRRPPLPRVRASVLQMYARRSIHLYVVPEVPSARSTTVVPHTGDSRISGPDKIVIHPSAGWTTAS